MRREASALWSRFRLEIVSLLTAVLLAVTAGAVAFVAVAHRDQTYLASTATLLDQPTAIARSQNPGVIDKLSRLRFKYAGILRSDSVVDPVAAKLNMNRGAVAGSIVSRGDTGSLLLFVGARATTRQKAVQLSNELARQLAAYIAKEQSEAAIPPIDRVSLRVVAPARGAALVSPTTRQRYVATAGAIVVVLVLSLGVADLVRRRRA